MRHSLLLLVALLGTSQTVRAQAAPTPGSCTTGIAVGTLDINNALGRVFNTGSLFFGGSYTSGNGYLIPKSSSTVLSPIYAAGIWIGGQVGPSNELRLAGATYGSYNFWPGPLGSDGRPVNPKNCSAYDHIYSVTRNDILAFESGAGTAQDLANWPYQLGAPVIDGDGNPDNYDLGAGDRPDIIGDQGLWWIMNDVGGPHTANATPVLGVEVRVLAWAFSRSDALGNATFYKYTIVNKSGSDIKKTYVSVFSDPDLGDGTDDYVGSDPELGLGYVYNGTNTDANYGTPAPAAGFDFFQGPIVPDRNGDGLPDTLGTSAFSYFSNQDGANGDPGTGRERYFFQQGLWGDGTTMRSIGDGFQQTGGEVTTFAFPGDPVRNQPWSEINPGPGLSPLTASDRRILISTGPFDLNNGDEQDIVFGLLYAQGTSYLNSITKLRSADVLAQTAYDAGFKLPSPPPAPSPCADRTQSTPVVSDDFGSGQCLEVVSQDNRATLVWGYGTSSPNYLGKYDAFDVFLTAQGAADSTYTFEGFKVYRYPTSSYDLSTRELVATLDLEDGIPPDNGLAYSFDITNLTNYRDYFYGVSAYAYNEESQPQELESSDSKITVSSAALVGGIRAQSAFGDSVSTVATAQRGGGTIGARVVDPTAVTGAKYTVEFFANDDGSTNYNIRNLTTGALVLDGAAVYASTGTSPQQIANVIVADGLSFSVTGPVPGPLVAPGANPAFVEVTGPGGTNPCGDGAGSTGGCPLGNFVYGSFNRTSASVPGRYLMFHGGSAGPEGSIGGFAPNEFEIRFTPTGSLAYHGFSTGRISRVPFEVWDVGLIVPGQPNDPSDDVQIIPVINTTAGDTEADECTFEFGDSAGPFAGVGTELGSTDWIYAYYPTTTYADWAAAAEATNPASCPISPATDAAAELIDFSGRPLQRVIFQAAGATTSVSQLQGDVVRFYSTDPNLPGDSFVIDTDSLNVTTPTAEEQNAALDRIAAVPNPYYGQSTYETGNLSRIVRFTNLPADAVQIKIFTVSGSLIRTLDKSGPSRSLDWNLETANNLPVASGMYLAHVDVPGVGERTLKLGIINRRTQITVF